MPGIFGAPTNLSSALRPQRANGIQLTAADYGKVLTVLYGRGRLSGDVLDYFGFQAIAQNQSVGGKGGGGSITSYVYSTSFLLALCEGPVQSIGTVWKGTDKVDMGTLNGATFLGAAGEAAWAKLPAGHDLTYPYMAKAGIPDLNLGGSPTLPNLNFEVFGLLPFGGGILDAEPSAILNDAMTNAVHGLGFNYLGDLTLFQYYCTAYGIFLSPQLDTEQAAQQFLDGLLQLTNSAAVWSDGALKIVPYGDEALTANGVTYTPATTVQYDLTDDDFQDADEPVKFDRAALADLPNAVQMEIIDAGHEYVTSQVEAKDQADIDVRGVRNPQTIQAHAVKDPAIGRQIAQRILQRELYIRNTYTFTLPINYILLEPMDVVTLTEDALGLDHEPVRITKIEEVGTDDGSQLQITAEEFPAGVSEAAEYATEPHAGTVIDTAAAPDTTQTPIFIRAPQYLAGTPEIWIGAAGAGPAWGGANVWVSSDGGAHYEYVATIHPGCRYGTLTAALADNADPDNTNTLKVGLYSGELISVTAAQKDAFASMLLVEHELISYENAVLGVGGEYDLTNLRRGGYGTAHAAHALGAPAIRVDEYVCRVPFDPGQVGQTLKFKFTAFNLYGGGQEDLSVVPSYDYIVGSGEEVPDVPPVPTGFAVTAIADGVHLSWDNPNPAAVFMTWVEFSAGAASWSTLHGVGGGGEHYDHHFTDGSKYYYRLRTQAPKPSQQYSGYTAVLDSTGKVVSNGADVSPSGANQIVDPFFSDDTHWDGGSFPLDGTLLFNALSPSEQVNSNNLDGMGNSKRTKISTGDYYAIGIEVYTQTGTATIAIQILFYQRDGTFTGSYNNTVDASSGSPFLVGKVTTANVAFAVARLIAKGGASGGSIKAWNPIFRVGPQTVIDPAGAQLYDQRNNIPLVGAGAYSSYVASGGAMSESYNSGDNTYSVTIAALTLRVGSQPVSYNSVTSPHLAPGTTFYFAYQDRTYAGDAPTLQYSTAKNNVNKFDDYLYIGSYTTGAGGGGGGGGGGPPPCVGVQMFVLPGVPASRAHTDTMLDGAAAFKRDGKCRVTSMHVGTAPCVRLVAEDGCACIASKETTATLQDGTSKHVGDMVGDLVLTDLHDKDGSPIVSVTDVGSQPVAHIRRQGNESYAAGERADRRIYLHNPSKP